ncbi:cysteine--tRNA ligase [Alteraurantiacibacter aquimixticola]|uniref:Cysteine--tRNA ligase n=1 Tax=Alteraurantiacibacter aquimixticola TaxID=2489173 RepID=A0A4T3F5U5_9SPHN|nr:cysteine--tRNA ligase [Alteraurantiacibacter aquimixticola]TIX51859.1 cysteine--tRNA ligase [Alteraurantiacibacter aquimixticola]
MSALKLFNSLTRKIETFHPVHDGEARVYTCGPTVYNYPHIGNMRAYVFADLLGRTLSWKGFKLTHVINITDVGHLTDDADAGEDKMEKMAAERAQSIWDIAKHYTEAYWADVKALNIRQPAHWSVATDYIEEMLEFAKSIADKHCYELDSGLYFDVSTVEDYGRLARAVTEEGEGRIETVEGKRNAADFAIWRKTPPGEKRQMEWDSLWGKGAPGWHLECSVMSGKLLGFPFDIHTGGIDHREIHHPNEIAQNQAFCGCGGLGEAANSGARIWMHNNFLVERSGKMSKSAGEFLRLQLLIDKGYHPLAYRMMCLQAHYRSELEFSWEGLEAALTRLKRVLIGVEKARAQVETLPAEPEGGWTLEDAHGDIGGQLLPLLARFDEAMADDLNSPQALTVFEELLAMKKVDPEHKLQALAAMDAVLGLGVLELERADLRVRPKTATITEAEIEDALARRKEARAAKDFATSDALRDELAAKGVEVMDGDPLGWEWQL